MQTLTIEDTYPVELGEIKEVLIFLIGCGGTGSFLAMHLARLAWTAREQHDLDIKLYFVDPDVVEEVNLGRQAFCPAELGQPKSLTLAARYSAAFGIPIHGYPTTIQEMKKPNTFNQHVIYVGAVDNVEARAAIDDHFTQRGSERRRWWIDCGNHEGEAGQVLLGNSRTPEPVINPLGFCSQLPLPSVQAPELVETPEEEADASEPEDTGDESCADLVLRGTQSLMINQMVASWAAQYLYRLLITRDLDIYATYFNLSGGKADSVAITGSPGELA